MIQIFSPRINRGNCLGTGGIYDQLRNIQSSFLYDVIFVRIACLNALKALILFSSMIIKRGNARYFSHENSKHYNSNSGAGNNSNK